MSNDQIDRLKSIIDAIELNAYRRGYEYALSQFENLSLVDIGSVTKAQLLTLLKNAVERAKKEAGV